jgi:hypothetical protein
MSDFPRTKVGGLSVSRMIIGTNWFLGWSHCTAAKDNFIKQQIKDRRKIADILEVYLKRGVDTVMGLIDCPPLLEAIQEAQDRVGRKMIVVSTPGFPTDPTTPEKGFDQKKAAEILDTQSKLGAAICMPHQGTTDLMLDRCTRKLRKMDLLFKMMRDRKLIPGLSTHMPEAIIYADETGADVETYISLFNPTGFMMPIEVDWVARVIQNAGKPVMVIKSMAAGQIRPFQALTFVWNAIRDKDMVTVGVMTPDEAAENIELSLSILERRKADLQLQETRSKASVKTKE